MIRMFFWVLCISLVVFLLLLFISRLFGEVLVVLFCFCV